MYFSHQEGAALRSLVSALEFYGVDFEDNGESVRVGGQAFFEEVERLPENAEKPRRFLVCGSVVYDDGWQVVPRLAVAA